MRRVGQHPHILPLLWGWEQRGRLYLLTHFCPWGSLGELWGRPGGQGMGEWRLWGYLWDLLLALRHLHACPIAHLDLKPANVLLTHGGCRLADFGTAVAPRLPHSNPQLPHVDPRTTQSDPRPTCTAPQMTRSDPQPTHELTYSDPQLPHTASQPTSAAPQLSHGDSQPPHTFQFHTYGAGDPRYVAPEALMGQGGPPSDIFSLALTILELGGSQRLPPWGEGWQELRRGGLPQSAAPGMWGRVGGYRAGIWGCGERLWGRDVGQGCGGVGKGYGAVGWSYGAGTWGRAPSRIVGDPPHLRPIGLSEELRGVLGAMMELDPRRRPTAAELLTWGAVRRAGRWRVLTRWADAGLRGMEALGEVAQPHGGAATGPDLRGGGRGAAPCPPPIKLSYGSEPHICPPSGSLRGFGVQFYLVGGCVCDLWVWGGSMGLGGGVSVGPAPPPVSGHLSFFRASINSGGGGGGVGWSDTA
uniref:non-specific serine/threonine protein kinase n=1 Tax=Calidris pygmaea TaxID=425635 RepID=A0A8C3KMJ4_9CHAR